ncbi:hypothetical protein NP233_g4679 [Leucocoprinus birnbaumii]|uniref:Uncharacterized protein n=1 Tax=Leucocoprinus birnbaumii TaxID=56174 RepID=A0AAD5VWY6_9AGAR|nr:hypothetical protein NP233_g4679 [Leucocoprinus birnbaumii]
MHNVQASTPPAEASQTQMAEERKFFVRSRMKGASAVLTAPDCCGQPADRSPGSGADLEALTLSQSFIE